MGKIFGTDGVRGIVNTGELTCDLAMRIGQAASSVLTSHANHKAKIIIGKDTRVSSDMLVAALTAGICSVGSDAYLIGAVPTPAVAYLVKKYNADAGVMISASHNPAEFNGIKLFSSEGYKLGDDIENEIEELIESGRCPLSVGTEVGRIYHLDDTANADYIDHLVSTVSGDLSGMKIAVDCANGSAAATAEKLFARLGVKAYVIADKPDGININKDCGSTEMDRLSRFVQDNNLDAGIAFDGDADRCLAVDENGGMVDGDKIMAILAKSLSDKGRLAKNTVTVTVMSNLGFYRFAEAHGINAVKTKVGDRYVLENMLENGYVLGGEQSGHIIFGDYCSTGDGQLSAIQLLSVLKEKGCKMSELAAIMKRYPQTMQNITASDDMKKALDSDNEIKAYIKSVEDKLGNSGRVLVRASGTEPLIRVMAECADQETADKTVKSICDKIKERLE